MNATVSPPSPAPSARAARANELLADFHTPLIADCWYVAGWSHEFTRELRERSILGRSLVFYRAQDGAPVALQNRCPHRSFPLACGQLEADTVRCGYHGLAFDRAGTCVDIPSQNVIGRNVRIRAYPLRERGPFVWIWMGEPEQADEALIPRTDWLTSTDWAYATNYVHLASNYVGLHENLMDLTHFTYLHPTTLGTPEYARTPFEVRVDERRIEITRLVPSCDVPPIYRRTGIQGKMSRHTVSEFISPALHHASAVMRDLSPAPGARDTFTILISHFITPESQHSAHYWFAFARDFLPQDPAVTAYMGEGALTAFTEDLVALHAIQRMHTLEPDAPQLEINIKSDQAGVAVRRHLRRLALGEAAPALLGSLAGAAA